MNRKLNTGSLKTAPTALTNDRPTILGGARMEKFQLPVDFDMTYHKKVLASGKVKASTPEDYAREIERIKQKLKDGLG
jgi:hypothetical protein